MLNDEKKVVIVGVGMVGMSFAYALLNQNICDELVLIDINQDKIHIYCAMQLYLDFINIFLRILSLFGKSKD